MRESESPSRATEIDLYPRLGKVGMLFAIPAPRKKKKRGVQKEETGCNDRPAHFCFGKYETANVITSVCC